MPETLPEGARPQITLEAVVDAILEQLAAEGVLPRCRPRVSWDAFLRLSDRVHSTFSVPSTTFTPVMRRLTFALASAARPRRIVGVGTFVGYTFAWLLGDRAEREAPVRFDEAIGIDHDPAANRLARENCRCLGHGGRLHFLDTDGVGALSGLTAPVDLLYLDLDDPRDGKAGYATALGAALPRLAPGALVLAHDPCVARFRHDIRDFHRAVSAAAELHGPWVLPVDACGLSVAVRRRRAA